MYGLVNPTGLTSTANQRMSCHLVVRPRYYRFIHLNQGPRQTMVPESFRTLLQHLQQCGCTWRTSASKAARDILASTELPHSMPASVPVIQPSQYRVLIWRTCCQTGQPRLCFPFARNHARPSDDQGQRYLDRSYLGLERLVKAASGRYQPTHEPVQQWTLVVNYYVGSHGKTSQPVGGADTLNSRSLTVWWPDGLLESLALAPLALKRAFPGSISLSRAA